ncbi:hypothetical protein G4B88_005960 [Cannabis sativa]|uniref:Terpene cyclase/mutase family member n=1 Tax=Cannabis sativa TaxID=3483 RepID=A0A7J6IAE6_CANSA|nr:hypothetical protein G4B88_005960 [Cannabis sativa]
MWKIKFGSGGEDPYLYSTNNFLGRQIFEFDEKAGTHEERAQVEEARHNFYKNRYNVTPCSDLICRFQDDEEITYEKADAAMRRSINFWSALQSPHGHWPAQNAGVMFYIPPLVFCMYICGHLDKVFNKHHKREMLWYMYCHQNEDGGWGLHIQGPSMMMCTVLNYLAMRILGESADGGLDNACSKAQKWIHDHGGAVGSGSWGKTWMAILGVYEWDGCNPMPPEFWFYPSIVPLHPCKYSTNLLYFFLTKMFCYCRLTFMPMSYFYGRKFVSEITPLIKQLREEIHIIPYKDIKWSKMRHVCAKEDNYYPHGKVQRLLWDCVYYLAEPIINTWPFNKIREKAVQRAMEHIHYEDENSRYITIGCVEKPLMMLACWVEDPDGEYFKKHIPRVDDYLWVAEDGLTMQSFGSQTWDCSLTVQALFAGNINKEIAAVLKKAHEFLKMSQVRENPPNHLDHFRHISKGAWTFSDRDHGWQVSDCTAEALKCCLLLGMMRSELVGEPMKAENMYDAVNVIMSLQSPNGGVSAWEPTGAPKWLEFLNPVEFLEDLVIEYEYIECTSSSIQALNLFRKSHPGHREKEVDKFITNAANYLEDTQMADGSWYGNWGICFVYGTWFAIRGLEGAGRHYNNCEAVRRGVEFLLETQREDGGWAESYTSYGDFPQQELMGVFMRNCMSHYAAYRNIFPNWALAEYRNLVPFPSTN